MPQLDVHSQIAQAARLALASDVPLETVHIEVEAIEGLTARVRVSDKHGEYTPIFGFLKQDAQSWRLLSAGTDFEPEFYQAHQIPETLRLA